MLCQEGQEDLDLDYSNHDRPESPMQVAKFRGNLSTSWFWRRRFLKGFTINGRASCLGHVTQMPRKYSGEWPNGFKEDVELTDDGLAQ